MFLLELGFARVGQMLTVLYPVIEVIILYPVAAFSLGGLLFAFATLEKLELREVQGFG